MYVTLTIVNGLMTIDIQYTTSIYKEFSRQYSTNW
jgi:hypothetical protein